MVNEGYQSLKGVFIDAYYNKKGLLQNEHSTFASILQ
jgi:hypothetical protein